MADVDNKTVFTIFTILAGSIAASWGWLIKHLSNSSKHPCKDDVVYRDVCEKVQEANTKEHTHLEDCIEGAIKRSDERCIEHKKMTDQRHVEFRTDMKEGFAEIKALIKNG